MSPTARTLEFLRKNGYIAGIVERIIPRCFTKSDLFGWCDIIAVPGPEFAGLGTDVGVWPTVYVQTTSHSNHLSRKKKVLGSAEARIVLAAGNAIWVVSWRQAGGPGGRWSAAVEPLSLADFSGVQPLNSEPIHEPA